LFHVDLVLHFLIYNLFIHIPNVNLGLSWECYRLSLSISWCSQWTFLLVNRLINVWFIVYIFYEANVIWPLQFFDIINFVYINFFSSLFIDCHLFHNIFRLILSEFIWYVISDASRIMFTCPLRLKKTKLFSRLWHWFFYDLKYWVIKSKTSR